MPEMQVRVLGENITARNLVDRKFKTMRISFNMLMPLTEEYAAVNAILPTMVSRVTKNYPDYTSLSRYLSALYGAGLSASVSKVGDNQLLSVSVSGISNRYALEGENIAGELTALMCSALFDPYLDEEGLFPEESFRQERRQLLETIEANFNDKKVYAKQRCTEIFYEGEPAAISHYGTKESLSALKREELLDAWKKVLRESRIEILVLGDCDFAAVCRNISSKLNFERAPVELRNRIVLKSDEVKEVTESMKLAQSKLVMAFRAGVTPEDSAATKVMCVLFGGSPSSKLFLNVREKMSLCYYCSSRYSEVKGSIFVESGVETANIDRAKEAIIQQLEDIKAGDFSEDDLQFAKLAMANSYKSVGDSLYSLESWYIGQLFAIETTDPETMADIVSEVSRIDVINAARKVTLDTVYVLKGEA